MRQIDEPAYGESQKYDWATLHREPEKMLAFDSAMMVKI
jgi:hypothetical protein